MLKLFHWVGIFLPINRLKRYSIKTIYIRYSHLSKSFIRKNLKTVLQQNLELIPKDFVHRIESNPQRIFDHKDPKVKELIPKLPILLDHLDLGKPRAL